MTLHLRIARAALHASQEESEDPRTPLREEATWDLRFLSACNHFFREVTATELLGGMAAGQIIFAPLRATILNALWNPLARSYLYGSLSSRFVATGIATAMEAPIFWGTSKAIETQTHSNLPIAFGVSSAGQEIAALGMTMGMLRVAGFGAGAMLQAASRVPVESWVRPAASWVGSHPGLVHTAASVAGLYGIHWFEAERGWRPDHGAWDRGVDALVATLQFGWTGNLATRLLGQRFQNFQARLEQVHQSRINPSSPKDLFHGSFAWEGPTPHEGNFLAISNFPEDPAIKVNQGIPHPHGAQGSASTQEFILKVLERGKPQEINELKNLIFEVYGNLGFKLGERVARYFSSQDWEEWKSGIRIIAIGEQTTPLRVAQALEQHAKFNQFSQKWYDQPHFRSPEEVPLKIHGRIRNQAATENYLKRMKKILWESPSQSHLGIFLKERNSAGRKKLQTAWEQAKSPSGRTLLIGQVEQACLVLEFNEAGFLAPPIHYSALPEAGWIQANLAAYSRGDAWEPAAPPPPPPFPPLSEPLQMEHLPGKRNQIVSDLVRALRKILSQNPHEGAIPIIKEQYKKNKHDKIFGPSTLAGTQRAYLFNRKQHGIILRFEANGKLIQPIHVGNSFTPQWIEKLKASLQKGEWDLTPPAEVPAPPPAPVPSPQPSPEEAPVPPVLPVMPLEPTPKLILNPGDNPTTFAFAVIEKSKGLAKANQLDLSETFERMIQSDNTRAFALETVDRLSYFTQGADPQTQAVVQALTWEGLDKPLQQFITPSVYFPEAHSQFFAQTLRSDLIKTGKIDRMLDFGSGSGWLPLYLRKLDLVGEAVGYDPQESAQAVGRINAIINGVHRIYFHEGPTWGRIQKNPANGLVVTSMARISRMSGSDGTNFIHQLLFQSRRFLNKRGRVLFQGSGESEAQWLAQMFKRNRYHIRSYLTSDQDTDPATRPFLLDAYPF